ncbi:MAG: type I secretion C-terminal target domain-containing protein [Alphaproteobacteria bacterium]
MPISPTKVFLSSLVTDPDGGYSLISNDTGDLNQTVLIPSSTWLSGIADLNGDLIPETITGGPGDDDRFVNAGRIYVNFGQSTGGTATLLPDEINGIVIDGVNPGDLAGSSVGSVADLNGDGLAEILVGAPMMENGVATDQGVAYVLWGQSVGGGIDLGDPLADGGVDNGLGFAMTGQAAGDRAGEAITAIGDLNGDGKAEILVGASGNDAGGADAGAAYVVYGTANEATIDLNNVAAGTGGFRIVGQNAGDGAGRTLGSVHDLNGDGKDEILIGAAGYDNGAINNAGAVYVAFGQSGGTEINLDNVAAGTGGFRITGATAGSGVGSAISGVGDINGDGLSDILIAAPGQNKAYVVFGKNNTNEVLLSDVEAGIGGFAITAQAAGDLVGMSVAGGGDFNRDGLADIVIGAPHNAEGGFNAGAVYIVWGGAGSTVDLSAVATGAGGAKIVGTSGSLTGSSVATLGDLNGDGASDLILGRPGLNDESVSIIYAPTLWQPDVNVYGTNGVDVMGFGYGGVHKIGDGVDNILGLNGNDTIDAAGGDDIIDGGAGADAMTGGAGDDTYYVDNAGDTAIEIAGGGTDTVLASVSHAIGAEVENLTLMVAGLTGTGNDLVNTITGTSGSDTLDGGIGADVMNGGLGNDTYKVDDLNDATNDTGGIDTVVASVDSYVLNSSIENLTLAGAAHIANGNALANTITGTSGADIIDGAVGADTMVGGLGDDTYYVDNALDRTTEAGGGGTDTVLAGVSYTLNGDVENLTMTVAGLVGTGNSLANSLIGTDGADTLDGAGGADSMSGGSGDDTYKVDNIGDVVTEAVGGGNDTVITSLDGFVLTEGELENLTLTGAARIATGNSSVNILTGTLGADTLDGAGGADTMIGLAGNDTYKVDDLGDVTTEVAGGGIDTVIATVDGYVLNAEVENLTLAGLARTGTGNAQNNILIGTSGVDTLYGLDGNDELDGGIGGDHMEGGLGDDTYYVDDLNDVVIEGLDGGFDKVVTNFNYVLADNIESARITGTGHSLIGNSGHNHLAGESGDDLIDGGEGDDIELGGDGDDHLISHSGSDSMSGGSGDDVYEIHGGSAHIEDFHGHDTIDASGATGNSYIDLSGNTVSHVQGQDCYIGQGGTTFAPLDVQFLQDLTGSFADDIANVKTLVPSIVSAMQAVQANSTFGVSSFVDKAVSPFGAPGEWVYKQHLGLTSDAVALGAAYSALTTNNGMDIAESQIESLMHLALHSAEVGFRPDSARFVVLFTDAPFHVAGDGAAGGITNPNNGDGVLDGAVPGTGEDYPFIAQVKSALEAANIIPIFAIAGGHEATYQGLVTGLGRGTVVTLTSNSSNVVAAITAGLTAATVTHIEDVYGGTGDDTMHGNDGNNHIGGNSGNDTMYGGGGDDTMDGGEGFDDTVTYATAAAGVIVNLTTGTASGEGTDTLVGVENIIGSGFDDVLTGNATTNDLFGGEGNDVLAGRADGDLLDGGNGIDTADYSASTQRVLIDLQNGTASSGEAQGDVLVGIENIIGSDVAGGGKDTIYGNSGVNVISGLNGDDIIEGGAGGDIMDGGAGWDTARYTRSLSGVTVNLETNVNTGGDAQDDQLSNFEAVYGSNHIDNITGSVNADTLNGAGGNDIINGGLGNDTLLGAAGNDTLNGGEGVDTASYAFVGTGVVVNLATGTATGEGSDTLSLIENVTGSGFNDTLTGDTNANALLGGNGNDTFVGGAGGDTLNGGNGVDTANYSTSSAKVVIDLQNGTASGGDAQGDILIGIENIVGSNIIGGAQDTIYGNASANNISGLAGDDIIEGGAGSDVLDGGAGWDTVRYTRSATGVTVNLETNVNTGGDAQGDQLSNFEAVYGSNHIDNITGGVNADVLNGAGGNDVINGGAGNDTLLGAAGNDTLNGGANIDTASYAFSGTGVVVNLATGTATGEGSDTLSLIENVIGSGNIDSLIGDGNANTLNGGAGNDLLYGAGGLDTLIGGLGADTFVFEAASAFSNIDKINDFSVVQGDKIDLNDVLDVAFDPLTSVISDFVNFTNAGANSVMSIDVDGSGAAFGFVDVATVNGVLNLDEQALYTGGNLLVA